MFLVFVAIGFMAFMVCTTLTIDIGMLMTARGQAQNSADAGALAAAIALAKNSYTDRSASGPAVQSGVNAARANDVMFASQAEREAMVGTDDVQFLNSPSGDPDWVRVTVRRVADRGNGVRTLIAGLFGVPRVDIAATAVAEAAPANAVTCVKPFMIPDKWIEGSSPANSLFDLGPDTYVPADQPGYTGYTVENDVGTVLTLRAANGDEVSPSFYFSWAMPGGSGGAFYRDNIENCNWSEITWDQVIVQEPGSMQGPTIQGITALIDRDPSATWDATCNCVVNSAYTGTSPRVFPIPLYDPQFYAEGKASGRPADFRIANFLGFFVESTEGSAIYGRITTLIGYIADGVPAGPQNALPRAVRLVE
jgi:hypothetical protein